MAWQVRGLAVGRCRWVLPAGDRRLFPHPTQLLPPNFSCECSAAADAIKMQQVSCRRLAHLGDVQLPQQLRLVITQQARKGGVALHQGGLSGEAVQPAAQPSFKTRRLGGQARNAQRQCKSWMAGWPGQSPGSWLPAPAQRGRCAHRVRRCGQGGAEAGELLGCRASLGSHASQGSLANCSARTVQQQPAMPAGNRTRASSTARLRSDACTTSSTLSGRKVVAQDAPCSPITSPPEQRHIHHREHAVGLGGDEGRQLLVGGQVGHKLGGLDVVARGVAKVEHACKQCPKQTSSGHKAEQRASGQGVG